MQPKKLLLATGTLLLSSLFSLNLYAAEKQISISQALKNLESAGYQQINSVKRAGAGFKAQAKDKNGQNVRIYLDSEGKFIDKPYKRGKHGAGFKHRHKGHGENQQGKRWQKQATPGDKQQ